MIDRDRLRQADARADMRRHKHELVVTAFACLRKAEWSLDAALDRFVHEVRASSPFLFLAEGEEETRRTARAMMLEFIQEMYDSGHRILVTTPSVAA